MSDSTIPSSQEPFGPEDLAEALLPEMHRLIVGVASEDQIPSILLQAAFRVGYEQGLPLSLMMVACQEVGEQYYERKTHE